MFNARVPPAIELIMREHGWRKLASDKYNFGHLFGSMLQSQCESILTSHKL